MSQIEKVQIINRRLISDERGWFLKAITGTEDGIPNHTGEVYLTMGKPEATEEEIEAEVAKLAEQYNMEAEQIKAAVPQQQLSADIVTRKAVDFVVENAVKE